jgi:hypothetical protein
MALLAPPDIAMILDHITVAVSNFERSKTFYERASQPLGSGVMFQFPGGAAIAARGKDNGKPGVLSQYHPNYYGAFVLGPDGYNVEAVCHAAP